jgi:hypothetical protein
MSLFRVSAPIPAVSTGPAVHEPLTGRPGSARPVAASADDRAPDEPTPPNASTPPTRPVYESDLTRAIVQHRNILFGVVVFFLLATFNGVWLIGRDSSLYRGLAHNLAIGRGYTFGEFAPRTVYPGYPLLLAGIEKVFGEGAVIPLIVMKLMAGVIVVLTYRLMRLHYPQWIAVAAAFFVGINGRFVAQSNELMTDTPFMLGVVLLLYGWQRLKIACGVSPAHVDSDTHPESISKITAGLMLVAGAAIAATTRPTFLIVALAWCMVCTWRILRGPHRRFYLLSAAMMVAIVGAFAAVELNSRGFRALGGGYSRDAVHAIEQITTRVPPNVSALLSRDMLSAFLGNRILVGLNPLLALFVIASSYTLFRRGHLLWGLMVYLTVAVTLMMTTIPRYFLMVLPLMVLGWLLLWSDLASRVSVKRRDLVLLAGLMFLTLPNVARCISEISGQHFRHKGNRDSWAEEVEMADHIRRSVPENGKVISPSGSTIMSYLSGRQVLQQRELIPRGLPELDWPKRLAQLDVHYAIFPSTLYVEQEQAAGMLMRRGVIFQEKVLASVALKRDGVMELSHIRVVLPPDGVDWRTTEFAAQAAAAEREHKARMEAQAKADYEARKRADEAQKLRLREEAKAKARMEARLKARAERKRLARLEESRKALAARKEAEKKLFAELRRQRAAGATTKGSAAATQPSPATAPAGKGK